MTVDIYRRNAAGRPDASPSSSSTTDHGLPRRAAASTRDAAVEEPDDHRRPPRRRHPRELLGRGPRAAAGREPAQLERRPLLRGPPRTRRRCGRRPPASAPATTRAGYEIFAAGYRDRRRRARGLEGLARPRRRPRPRRGVWAGIDFAAIGVGLDRTAGAGHLRRPRLHTSGSARPPTRPARRRSAAPAGPTAIAATAFADRCRAGQAPTASPAAAAPTVLAGGAGRDAASAAARPRQPGGRPRQPTG